MKYGSPSVLPMRVRDAQLCPRSLVYCRLARLGEELQRVKETGSIQSFALICVVQKACMMALRS
jgi:hypothetical protein